MSKQRTARISKMEAYLDESEAAVRGLEEAAERYEAVMNKYYRLEDYYGSTKWIEVYEADEAGLLPADLKRGVLSEDAVYDLITDHNKLMARLQRIVLRSLEKTEPRQ